MNDNDDPTALHAAAHAIARALAQTAYMDASEIAREIATTRSPAQMLTLALCILDRVQMGACGGRDPIGAPEQERVARVARDAIVWIGEHV